MIQLSALATSGPDNSLKTATFAGLAGAFESLLASETDSAADEGGKILPEGGKVLPDTLPVSLIFPVAQRKAPAKLAEMPTETAENQTDANGAEDVTETHTEAAQSDAETVVTGVQLALIPQLVSPATEAVASAENLSRQSLRHASSHPVPAEVRQAIRDAATAPTGNENQPQSPAAPRGLTTTPAALAAMTATIPAIAAPESARSAIEGEKPADAPQPSRIAPANRPEPIREIRFELSTAGHGESGADRPAQRQSGLSAVMAQPAAAVEAAGLASFEAPVVAAPSGKSEAAAPLMQQQSPAVRPQDLDALVERLVEARDNARAGNASVTVMHEDFGKVSLRFTHENGSLSVTMANNDPGFARAVNSAVAPDASMNGEAQSQADRRGDSSPGTAARTAASEQGGAGERNGNSRGDRGGRGEAMANPHRGEAGESRKAMGGIFA